MRYVYSQEFYGISYVETEYYDENGIRKSAKMKFDSIEHNWCVEVEDVVLRYKFVINHIIRLNDPQAGAYAIDEHGETWSVPGDVKAWVPKLQNYNISNVINAKENTLVKKATFVYDRPLDICVSVDVHNVQGLHSLTFMCFQPDGRIYKIEECSIGRQGKLEDYRVVFKNHIERMLGRVAEGMWAIQVYLDGNSMIKDYFVLKRKVISNNTLFNYKM